MSLLRPLYSIIIQYTEKYPKSDNTLDVFDLMFKDTPYKDVKRLLENRVSHTLDHYPSPGELEDLIKQLKGDIFESHQISVKIEKYFVNH
jgi:hypothetical protein